MESSDDFKLSSEAQNPSSDVRVVNTESWRLYRHMHRYSAFAKNLERHRIAYTHIWNIELCSLFGITL